MTTALKATYVVSGGLQVAAYFLVGWPMAVAVWLVSAVARELFQRSRPRRIGDPRVVAGYVGGALSVAGFLLSDTYPHLADPLVGRLLVAAGFFVVGAALVALTVAEPPIRIFGGLGVVLLGMALLVASQVLLGTPDRDLAALPALVGWQVIVWVFDNAANRALRPAEQEAERQVSPTPQETGP